MDWRIYYGDGSTFDSSMGSPEEAPGWNVQIIIQPHIESGHYFQSFSDYYIYRGVWFGVDIGGVLGYLVEKGLLRYSTHKEMWTGEWVQADAFDVLLYFNKIGLIKFGQTLPNDEFVAIHNRACFDPDFPPRTAWRPKERQP